MANQILAEISLRDYSRLVFSVGEWRGRQLASVRKFVTTQKYEGPTKAGLALASRLLSDLIVVLEELENSLPPKEEHEFRRITKSRTAYVRIATLPSGDEEVLPEVDVREFVDSATYVGPTKRGIRFRWDLVPEVLACLRQQANLVRENEAREPTLFGNGAPCPAGEESNLTRRSPRVDAVAEILSERVRHFPNDFRDDTDVRGSRIALPDAPLYLEQDNAGVWTLNTVEGVFQRVRNPVEANFIIYAQMRGLREVFVFEEMILVFKTVKGYENYVRRIQARLIGILTELTKQRSVAEYEARKKCQEAGLPWLV